MRNIAKKFLVLSLVPFLFSLASCSASSSSTAHAVAFTVNFLDDEGNNVGYKYVHYGESIEYASPTSSSGTTYDFISKSSKLPATGYRNAFLKWSGTYDSNSATEVGAYDSSSHLPPKTDGTEEIDPSNIKGSCTVKANFTETILTLKTRYKNASQNIMDPTVPTSLYSKSFDWGTSSLDGYFPTDPTRTPSWGHKSPFKGYIFASEDKQKEAETPFKASGIYYHGAGDPTAVTVLDKDGATVTSPVLGALYEDTSSYTLYGYDGVYTKIGQWNTKAYASNTSPLTITYYASFGDTTLDFTSKIYASESDFNNRDTASPSTPIGSISSSFAKSLTFDIDTSIVSGTKADGTAVSFDYSAKGLKKIKEWVGYFDSSSDTSNIYANGPVAVDYGIMADASFYPVYRDQKVVYYPSQDDATAGTNALDVVTGSTTQKYAYIDFGSRLVFDYAGKNITSTDAEGNNYDCDFSSITGTIKRWEAKRADGKLTLANEEVSQDIVVYPQF